jgi:hypothetical protein
MKIIATVVISIIKEMVAAIGTFAKFKIYSATITDITFSAPPRSEGITNMAMDPVITMLAPAKTPGRLNGKITVKNILILPAPRFLAASTNELSIFTNEANNGKII